MLLEGKNKVGFSEHGERDVVFVDRCGLSELLSSGHNVAHDLCAVHQGGDHQTSRAVQVHWTQEHIGTQGRSPSCGRIFSSLKPIVHFD